MIKICNEKDCPLHPEYVVPGSEVIEPTHEKIDLPVGALITDATGEIKQVDEDHNLVTPTLPGLSGGLTVHNHSGDHNHLAASYEWKGDWTSLSYDTPAVQLGQEETKILIEEEGIKMITPYFEGYAECLFCNHRLQYDMKREVIAMTAKKLLEE